MCIAFFYVNKDPQPGQYKLILVMNRDEYFRRSTEPASWNCGVLAGRDLQQGKEGGTWLAMNECGRIGFLTNIFTAMDPSGQGRGFLVIDYLRSTKRDAFEYLDQIDKTDVLYNPFNLILFEPSDDKKRFIAHYYLRGQPGHVVETELPVCLVHGVHAVSNSPIYKPFVKTEKGRMEMEDIVARYNNVQHQQSLIDSLERLASDRTTYFPDRQMEAQAFHQDSNLMKRHLGDLASVFVDIPEREYGTRMQTIVLIDTEDNVYFKERTRCTEAPCTGHVGSPEESTRSTEESTRSTEASTRSPEASRSTAKSVDDESNPAGTGNDKESTSNARSTTGSSDESNQATPNVFPKINDKWEEPVVMEFKLKM